MLAVVFLLSCTEVERDNPYDSRSINYRKGSSSSVGCNVGSYSCSMSGYRTTEINGQVWMAENLNCDVGVSYCNSNRTENCKQYGRLYDWCTAMAVCQNGWHLPSDEEWQELVDFAGGNYVAGLYLKAKDGWEDYTERGVTYSGNGEDTFGFSALPGGLGDAGNYSGVGFSGIWWSSSEFDDYWRIDHNNEAFLSYDVERERMLLSVRCLKN